MLLSLGRLTAGAIVLAMLGPAGPAAAVNRGSAPETCQGIEATIVGTAGDDRLTGTRARDVIAAGAGDDVVLGAGGGDLICGDAGADRLQGGTGNDVLLGHRGRDTLLAGAASDSKDLNVLVGGPERDRLLGTDDRSFDVADYSTEDRGATVDVRHPGRSDDLLRDVEIVLGSNHDDRLRVASAFAAGLGGSDRMWGACGLSDWAPDARLVHDVDWEDVDEVQPLAAPTTDGDDVLRVLPLPGPGCRDFNRRGMEAVELAEGRDVLTTPYRLSVTLHDLGDTLTGDVTRRGPDAPFGGSLTTHIDAPELHVDLGAGTITGGPGTPTTHFNGVGFLTNFGHLGAGTLRGSAHRDLFIDNGQPWTGDLGAGRDNAHGMGEGVMRGGDGGDSLTDSPAHLYGDGGDDVLGVRSRGFGGPGDDRVTWYDVGQEPSGLLAHGGPGDDVVAGGPADDELDGGGGYDRAFGGEGTDRCLAEETTECEVGEPGP